MNDPVENFIAGALVVVVVVFFILGILGLFLVIGVANGNPAETAYVAPCSGQYCVVLKAGHLNTTVTRPLPLDDARKAADEYNRLIWDQKLRRPESKN